MLNSLILMQIYILALQDNKFYINKLPINSKPVIESFISNTNSSNLYSFFGKGGYWLSLYPIIKVDHIIKIDIECDKIVKDYMAIYGAHNVRGCGFDEVAYSESDFLNIVRELNINYERENLEDIQDENINNSGKFINQCYHNDENMDCE